MIVNDAPEMGKFFGVDGFKTDNKLPFYKKIRTTYKYILN